MQFADDICAGKAGHNTVCGRLPDPRPTGYTHDGLSQVCDARTSLLHDDEHVTRQGRRCWCFCGARDRRCDGNDWRVFYYFNALDGFGFHVGELEILCYFEWCLVSSLASPPFSTMCLLEEGLFDVINFFPLSREWVQEIQVEYIGKWMRFRRIGNRKSIFK